MKKLTIITLILVFSLNQLAGEGSACVDTLRPRAADKATSEELAGQIAADNPKASSAGLSAAPFVSSIGLFRKISLVSCNAVKEDPERAVVTLCFQRIGDKGVKEATLRCRKRTQEGTWQILETYAKTGNNEIDNAIKSFLFDKFSRNNIKENLADLIIEDADIDPKSLFTLSDVAKIGISSAKIGGKEIPLMILHNDISTNKIAVFDVLARLAYQEGYLTLKNMENAIPEGEYKRTRYADAIEAIALSAEIDVPERIKFHYALEAFKAHKNIFGEENALLIKDINSLRSKPAPPRHIYTYIEYTQGSEADAVRHEKPEGREIAARRWYNAYRRYLRLNQFKRALECKKNAARNQWLAFKRYFHAGKYEKRFKREGPALYYFEKAEVCLKAALKLDKSLKEKDHIIRDFSYFGELFLQIEDYRKAAHYYEIAAKLAELSGRREDASKNWAQAAFCYILLSKYDKAGECDKRCAELCVKRKELELAIEHYMFAARSFYTAHMDDAAKECELKAKEINEILFNRGDKIRSIFGVKGLSKEALNKLKEKEVLLALVGAKAAVARSSGPVSGKTKKNIQRAVSAMRGILNKSQLKDDIGFLTRKTKAGRGGYEIWYCIYDRKKAREVILNSRNTIFKDEDVPDSIYNDDKVLDAFMDSIIGRKSSDSILLGYPTRDAAEYMRYRELLKRAGVDAKEAESIDRHKLLAIKLRYKDAKDDTAMFLESYYNAALENNGNGRDLKDAIGFNWVSRNKKAKKRYAVRYYAALTALDMILEEMKEPEVLKDFYIVHEAVELDVDEEVLSNGNHNHVNDKHKVAQAVNSQA